MVCNFKFVHYGHNENNSHSMGLDIIWAASEVQMEPKVLKLKGSSFGIRPSIYVLKGCHYEPTPKVPISVIWKEGIFAPLPTCWIVILKYHATKGKIHLLPVSFLNPVEIISPILLF